MFTSRQNSHIVQEIGVGEHDADVKSLTVTRNMAVWRMDNEKICKLALTYGRIAKIPASYEKSGSGNTMVMSEFWPEVEISLFRAHAMKNMQFGY